MTGDVTRRRPARLTWLLEAELRAVEEEGEDVLLGEDEAKTLNACFDDLSRSGDLAENPPSEALVASWQALIRLYNNPH